MNPLRWRLQDWRRPTARSARPIGCAAMLAALMLAGAPGAASAHEHGVLTISNQVLVAGDTIAITGAKFAAGSELTLTLTGVRGRVQLGRVRADTSGKFHTVIHVPDDVQRASYRIVATAADGDEVAAIDVAVVPWAHVSPTDTVEQRHAPSTEPLALPRARSPLVTGTALIGIALALILGVALLRRAAGAQ